MKHYLKTMMAAAILVFSFIGLLFVVFPSNAEASLAGDTIDWQYYYGGDEWNDLGGPDSFIAGDSSSDWAAIFRMSANDSQIIIDFFSAREWGTLGFMNSVASLDKNGLYIENGVLFTDNDNVFTSVSLNETLTTMSGFSSSNVTWNSNNIAITWGGKFFNTDTMIVLDIGTSNGDGPPTSVPEPATLLLLGSGIAGLLAGRKLLKR